MLQMLAVHSPSIKPLFANFPYKAVHKSAVLKCDWPARLHTIASIQDGWPYDSQACVHLHVATWKKMFSSR